MSSIFVNIVFFFVPILLPQPKDQNLKVPAKNQSDRYNILLGIVTATFQHVIVPVRHRIVGTSLLFHYRPPCYHHRINSAISLNNIRITYWSLFGKVDKS